MTTTGTTLRTMVTRSKDIRQMVVYGYARLVRYNEKFELVSDIAESFEVEEGRRFTFRLRPGVIRMVVGEPIATEGLEHGDRRELSRRAGRLVRRRG